MYQQDYMTKIADTPHKLDVISYDIFNMMHVCKFNGLTILVDLLVNGDFDDEIDPEELIGKTVSVEYTHTNRFLAAGVKICGM